MRKNIRLVGFGLLILVILLLIVLLISQINKSLLLLRDIPPG